MAAFDVVGVDFELGLGVDNRALTQDQVAAQLMGIDLLRVLAHDDFALEGAMRAARRDALDHLTRLAVRHLVIDSRDDVGFFAAPNDESAVEPALRPLASHPDAHLMPHRAAADEQRKAAEARLGSDGRIDLRQMHRLARFLDQHGAGQLGASTEPHGDDIVAPIPALAGIGFENGRAAALAEANDIARVHRPAHRGKMNNLNRQVQHDARCDVEHKTVFEIRRIQRLERVLGPSFAERCCADQIRPLVNRLPHRAEPHAVGQIAHGRAAAMSIHEHQPSTAAVHLQFRRRLHMAARLAGEQRLALQRLQIEIAPIFASAAREAQFCEPAQRALPFAAEPFGLAAIRALESVEIGARLGLDWKIENRAHADAATSGCSPKVP